YKVDTLSDYDETDFAKASAIAGQWGDKIPLGVIYQTDRMTLEESLPALAQGTLIARNLSQPSSVLSLMEEMA
ncbi:MAG: 2-oxoacid ferredoxin oxidoreductase, partial [Sporomusaceae bacterium]|nr:2-oxoacid ferredoxin oxidoreductase [Sporomusaceae bacterium]